MRAILAAIALTLALALHAPPDGARAAETFTLDNGMEVVVIEDRRAPVVVHMVWYKVGAADEPAGKSGIAHYLEHLMFKGTDTRESGEFSRLVAENGGRDNAFTGQDYTGYFQRVAADRLDLMMEMEADRMVNLSIDQAIADPERDVVIEERNQRTESSPGAIFGEQRMAVQYLTHPYGVPIIGWEHEILGLTAEDALNFYDAHYGPNNAILVVAGDVSADEVRTLAERYYGVIPPNPGIVGRVRPELAPQRAPRQVEFADPRVAQPYVVRTYLAPERDPGAQDEAAALRFLAALLGGEGPTPLMKRVLEVEEGTALFASAFYSGTSLDDTTFGLVVVPVEGRSLAEAEADLDRMIARFLDEGVDQAALDRLKLQLRADDIYEMDSLQRRARRYGAAMASGLSVADVEAWPDILQAVTADDIMDAANALFDPNRSVTGYLMRPAAAAHVEIDAQEVTQ